MRRKVVPLLVLISASISTSSDLQAKSAAVTDRSCEQHLEIASQKFDVPVHVLYAIGLVESGRNGKLYPLAMNVHGKTYWPKSLQDAMLIYQRSMASGQNLIDVGCMQINIHYHRDQFSSVEEMFNPKTNVEYAARFLRTLKDKHSTWTMAIARYHAGYHNSAAQRKYVCRVIDKLVSLKYAAPTQKTKKIC